VRRSGLRCHLSAVDEILRVDLSEVGLISGSVIVERKAPITTAELQCIDVAGHSELNNESWLEGLGSRRRRTHMCVRLYYLVPSVVWTITLDSTHTLTL